MSSAEVAPTPWLRADATPRFTGLRTSVTRLSSGTAAGLEPVVDDEDVHVEIFAGQRRVDRSRQSRTVVRR